MNTNYDFGQTVPLNIVYVKPVAVADLPEEIRDQAHGAETLYAVHREDGEQLALVADRKLAFVLARQHDMAPVAVH
ncbi:MAG: DUF1150 family protein [Marinovum algicola]|jgi:hypothetical protein|uniref:DUF1150 family protein n=1 Tax=Marinovum algicola TaxID=42444 RepID=A0A975ZN44_9RHOB|nr:MULTISPECIES: DUF1150 family protein [Marinovum]AKO98007.1 putative small protein [Marinovum algicola DG 898]MDD9741920.1 DUF1150 family protein [Marinovum sp. SP66]MDD9745010.1 DUF1150 family protein [Marinovum sp. PR37]SEJ35991.1 hypothetical protein SAMN04487940_105103 [Marinovum algicola]SLN38951.1 hypothetical protein MAA5396_01850 [Marinovum algicola]